MKKNTQIVVAGAVVLGLAAGGGTFALWSANAEFDGGGVQTGKLAIEKTDQSSYDDLTTASVANDWAASDKMVPGDIVEHKQDYKIILDGKNLRANLNLTGATASIPAALAADFTVDYKVSNGGVDLTSWTPAAATVALNPAGTPLLNTSDSGATYTISVRYTFKDQASNDAATQGHLAVSVPNTAKVTLTQVR
mgnify:CR=1 FL=1